MQLMLTLMVAAVTGLGAERLRLPGGVIVGSMLGAAAVTLLADRAVTIPQGVQSGAFVIVGAAIGVLVTRTTLANVWPVLLPAVVAAALIIVAGVGIAYLLRVVGLAPPADVLATSPGALSVVAALAAERGTGAVEVAMFHLVRIVMVILSLPLVLQLLPR